MGTRDHPKTKSQFGAVTAAAWQTRAKQYGIDTTAEELVLPDRDLAKLDQKIAIDLPDVARRIQNARSQGRDIIYLPGSYDLVHVGHLSYVDQVTRQYLEEAAKRGRKLVRADLYLVMLADDDTLIERVKAGKYIGHGGDEQYRRPIERDVGESGRSARLDALASFPIDCVGFIPSSVAKNLAEPYDLDIDQCRRVAATLARGTELQRYSQILDIYSDPDDLFAYDESQEDTPWRVAAWQLYVILQITQPSREALKTAPEPYSGKCITRVVSVRDSSYLGYVNIISRWAGVAVTVIDDHEVVSTTELIKRVGPQALLQRKADAIRLRDSSNSS